MTHVADGKTEFDIKKGWYKNIDGDGLEGIMREVFGQVEKQGDVFVSSYGAMKRIEAKVISRNRLGVLTANVDDVRSVSDEDILASKRKLNDFLFRATGFTPKDRLKKAKDKAKKGEL